MNRIYKQIYVSPKGKDTNDGTEKKPFKTLDMAIAEVKKINKEMTGDIIINIMPGYYFIDKTIKIDEWISGKNGFNVIIKGADKTQKPVLSGGVKVEGWKKVKNSNLWCAPLDVEGMRSLYINGYPAQRACGKYLYTPIEDYKEEGSKNLADGIVVSAENFRADYAHPEELELVWPLLWTLQRTPVEKMIKKGDKIIFILKQPCFDQGLTKDAVFTNPGADEKGNKKFYLENAKELLDEAGKFYWSKTEKKVYYWPFDEEDMETAEVYTCQTDSIIKLAGANKFNKVKNVIIDNIEFCYNGWNAVTDEGLVSTQADVVINKMYGEVHLNGRYAPMTVEINNADNVHLKNCYIHSVGTSAVCMSDAVKNSSVCGNKFTDIAGTAILVDNWNHYMNMPANMERCENLLVTNNVIYRAATEFKGFTAISIFFPKNTVVSHNDIKNTPYTAISFGWGWGSAQVTDAHSNRVEYNRIEDVTDVLHDGGHIYTLDLVKDGIIQGNYLIRAGEYRGGVYLDAGSADLIIRNNVMEQSEQWLFARAFVGLAKIRAYGNHFEQGSYSERDYVHVTDYHNVEAPVDENGNTVWPLEAQKIINFAGLEDEYKYMLEGAELPGWRKDIHDYMPQKEFANEKNTWINCASFIDGAGEGSAYHTRSGRVPQLESNAIDTLMNDIDDGDWLKYDIYIPKDGEYNCEMKCAQRDEIPKITAKVTINIDGKDCIVEKDLPKNGFYIDEYWRKGVPYPAVNLGKVKLTEGTHTIKITFIDNSPSFQSFRFFNEDVLKDLVYDEGAPV